MSRDAKKWTLKSECWVVEPSADSLLLNWWVAGDQQTYGGAGQDPEESHFLHNVLNGQLRSRDKVLEDTEREKRWRWREFPSQMKPG